MKLNICNRLIIGFTVVAMLTLVIAAVVGIYLLNAMVMTTVQKNVQHDLDAAHAIYDYKEEKIESFVHLQAERYITRNSMINRDRRALQTELSKVSSNEGLDILVAADADGRVFARAHNPEYGDISYNSMIHHALHGDIISGTEIMSVEDLLRENPVLADRARINITQTEKALPTTKPVETSGMMMLAASPIYDYNGTIIGSMCGGVLVNRNYEIVDEIRDVLYRGETYKGTNLGTATIFQDDLRISTNVPAEQWALHERAVGTRVSEEVRETVLMHGENWIGRAYVVNTWYVTAYEPLRNIDGDIIGMLYVGILEEPYIDYRNRIIYTFLAILVMGLLLSIMVSRYLACGIINPIRTLSYGAREVSKGNLDIKLKTSSDDEIGEFTETFNRMVADLRSKRDQLIESHHELKASYDRIHAMSRKLRSANRELKELDRTKTEFLNIATHELRTPLTAIRGFAEAVYDGTLGEINEKQKTAIEKVIQNSDRLIRLINDMLDLSKIRSKTIEYQMSKLDPNELITESIENLRPLIDEKNLDIDIDLGDVPAVIGDRDRLHQVIINLVSNAIKFTPENGRIMVTTRLTESGVEVSVRDTGYGIAPMNLAHVFDEFKQIGRGEGTGLGLAIAKKIVEAHGGTIWVESKIGEGSVFTFRLQAADSDP
ncbi:MAG: cache domain-containing protein [Candidatus Syntrophoarchaeum sp.]|nr:cache domain-containing protein [Methanosarcinales archaeon]MCW7077148.1 cache domain-containing protein [Candidatus Syntrophoarchaeum sp.]